MESNAAVIFIKLEQKWQAMPVLIHSARRGKNPAVIFPSAFLHGSAGTRRRFFLFLQQLGILGLQVFDLGQLLYTYLVKGIFGCLMEPPFS